MGVSTRIDDFQRRHRAIGFPLAVIYKFIDDQGVYLAALLTYYGFLSLFPLVLLLASILGFVLRDNLELRTKILDSALSQFPVIGDQLRDPRGLQGSGVALAVGALTAVYGALGVAQALQNALNISWAVPRHRRPNALKARLRSLVLLATAGIAVLLTTTLSIVAGLSTSVVAILVAIAAVVVNTAIFAVAFRIGTARPLRVSDVLPGAILAAVLWQVMQAFGTAYVARVVKDSPAAYGAFAFVLGLLAWAFILAIGVVLAIEVNVVRAKRLYPRSLLTPFTDRADLTRADRDTYRDAAKAQQHKGFEEVTVTFARDGLNATVPSQEEGEPLSSP